MADLSSIQALVKALEAGGYNAAPSELRQGCVFQVEDLAVVLERASSADRLALISTNRRVTQCVTMICECGAEKCKSNIHSDWCPKHA